MSQGGDPFLVMTSSDISTCHKTKQTQETFSVGITQTCHHSVKKIIRKNCDIDSLCGKIILVDYDLKKT